MNWSGVSFRMPLSVSGCSRLRMVPLASFVMCGTALTNEMSCTIRMGTRTRKARVTMPANSRKVTSIANHRGMRWESHRTGNEKTSASAKPPSRTTGTVGAAHMRSASAMRPSTRSAVLVRLEMRIGVGRDALASALVLWMCFRATANHEVETAIRGASCAWSFVP